MGFNTVVVVLNDHIHRIAKDPDFGRKVADAIQMHGHDRYAGMTDGFRVVSIGHADFDQIVRVGGNYGEPLPDDEWDAVQKFRRKKARAAKRTKAPAKIGTEEE